MRSNYIGLMVEDTTSLLIGLMSILKSGNCVVPINPIFPDDRIRYIVEDCRVGAILTDRVNHDRVRGVVRGSTCLKHVICIDEIDIESQTGTPPGKEESHGKAVAAGQCPPVDQPCYLIYTSGSTGKPKGVQITNRNLVPLLSWFLEYFKLGKHTRVLQSLSYTFDFGIFELITTMLSGGGLYFLDRKMLSGLDEYVDFIHRHRIETIHTTPSFFADVIGLGRSLSPVRLLHFGGERLTGKIVEAASELVGADCYIYNGYGPTETTINSAIYSIRAGDLRGNRARLESEVPANIPIGKPSANNIIYILDAHGNLQPQGVVGELYIGGTGVAGGYLNNPELTAEKFIVPSATRNPFINDLEKRVKKTIFSSVPGKLRESSGHKSVRREMARSAFLGWGCQPPTHHSPIYRTGDLVRWLPEGDVEFLGRIDHQVKIRGFRIELGEIEGRLLEYDYTKEAAVIDRKGENRDTYLCAYIVPDAGFNAGGGIKALKEFLKEALPDYMIPSAFVILERMPLSSNQKIDRKALPRPVRGTGEGGYAPPRNRTEETLAVIWSEVLGIEKTRIGIDGNFFELGGHSLKATALTGKIYKTLEVRIPLVEIFKTPTIRELARYIEVASKERYLAIDPVEKREYYPLSPAQMRLYLLYRIDPQSTGYNISNAMSIEGDIREEGLEEVFKQLIRRHESFRTSFREVEEEPVQVIHDEVSFAIEYYDIATEGTERKNYKSQITNQAVLRQTRPEEIAGSPGAPISAPKDGTKCLLRVPAPRAWPLEAIIKSFIRPFDLTKVPLLRVGIVQLPGFGSRAPGHFFLLVDMHHIIADGTSTGVLIDDFTAFYYGEELSPLVIQYKDFAWWQTGKTQKEMLEAREKYWLNIFDKDTPVLDMPLDFPRPVLQDFTGKTAAFTLGEAETAKLNALAVEQGATLFMVLLAVFNVMLAKLSGQEEIVVGTPVAGRRHVQLEKTIGMFINTLAIRSYLPGWKSFKGFLKEVKESALAAFENQDYPFEELVEKIEIKRDTGRNPLFDVMFVMQNIGLPAVGRGITAGDLKFKTVEYEYGISKFDMTFVSRETGEDGKALEFTVEYGSRLYKPETIQRYTGYFKRVAAVVTEMPDIEISALEIIPAEEKRKLVLEFNSLDPGFPTDRTLHGLFARQVEQGPHRMALVGGSEARVPLSAVVSLTYEEVDRESGRLAHELSERGVKPGAIVGLQVNRSVEMIIGILGILKAGAAYMP